MQSNQKVFIAGESLGVQASKERFREARKTITFLLDNYDEISRGGGDNVRRYLGTVGTTSALYGIQKVLKELKSEAEDIAEFMEDVEEFDYYLRAADAAAYSAIFVEYSAASTTPKQYFEDARKAIRQSSIYMEKLSQGLNL